MKGGEGVNMNCDQRESSFIDLLGVAILSMYSVTIFFTPMFSNWFEGYLPEDTAFLITVTTTAVIGSLVIVTVFRSRIIQFIYKPTDCGQSIWNEIVLYTLTYIPIIIVTGLLISLLAIAWSPTPDAISIIHQTLATGLTVGLLSFRRKGKIEFPNWLQVESWGTRDYITLFGGIFFLTYVYMNTAFGPTGALLVPFSLFCATLFVVLRWTGTFMPTEEYTLLRS